jgi:hypothetical protein
VVLLDEIKAKVADPHHGIMAGSELFFMGPGDPSKFPTGQKSPWKNAPASDVSAAISSPPRGIQGALFSKKPSKNLVFRAPESAGLNRVFANVSEYFFSENPGRSRFR